MGWRDGEMAGWREKLAGSKNTILDPPALLVSRQTQTLCQ